MNRREKLECLLEIEEVIKSYNKQIQLNKDTIRHRKKFNEIYSDLISFEDEINK